jgi:hypothetical protein
VYLIYIYIYIYIFLFRCFPSYSNCGLSVEKMPQAIMLVLTMFFGKLDPEVIDVRTRSASAYRNAIDKSSYFVTNKLKVELVKRTV